MGSVEIVRPYEAQRSAVRVMRPIRRWRACLDIYWKDQIVLAALATGLGLQCVMLWLVTLLLRAAP